MIRNLLGSSLLAALSMMALGAPLALAEQPAQLTAEAGAVTLDGSQPESQVQVFTRSGKQVFCEVATLDASATSGDETLTASPVYEECVMLGVGPATVKMNGCDLGLSLTREGSKFSAISSISCPEGKQIEILAYVSEAKHATGTTVCEYTLGSQSGLKTTQLTNEAASEATPATWILAHLEIGKLTSKSLKNELICGASSDATGTLEGEVEIKGTDLEKNPANVAVSAVPTQAVLTTEGGGNVVLTGTQEGFNELIRGARALTCEEEHLTATGEVANGATEAEFTPTFAKCHTNLGGPATVTNTGCKYRLKLAADEETPEDTWTAIASFHCNDANSHLVLHAYLNEPAHASGNVACQYTFTDWTNGKPTQHNQNLTTIDITNKVANPPTTTKNYLQMHLNIKNIVSTRTVGSALLCGPEVHTTGELIGTGHIKASSGINPTGITLSTKS